MTETQPATASAHPYTTAQFLCRDSDPEWLARRLEGIGASEGAMILGKSNFGGPAKVAALKLGYQIDDIDHEAELLKWGKLIEPTLIDWFREETGIEAMLSGGMFRHEDPQAAFVQATLDGVCREGGEWGGIECKLAHYSAKDWEEEGEVPEKYWIQMQQQMEVAGFGFSYALVALDGYRPRYKRVERDRSFFGDVLFPAEDVFWQAIQNEQMPEPMGAAEQEYKALQARFPEPIAGKAVKLSGDTLIETFENWQVAGAMARDCKKAQEEARNILAYHLGDAEVGILDNGQIITWKAQTRTEKPRTAAECKSTTFRVLRAKAAPKR